MLDYCSFKLFHPEFIRLGLVWFESVVSESLLKVSELDVDGHGLSL